MRAIHLEKSGFFASLLAAASSFESAPPASAHTLKSTLTFLLCSERSMSRCMIFASGANFDTAPVILSSKRVPRAMSKSDSNTAMLPAYVPCIPNQ